MSGAAAGGQGPLRAVLGELSSGAHSLDEVAERTGLARETVSAAVDQLVRMGRLEARELAIGCPDGGCGSCASGQVDGSAGCGASGPAATRSGPVLVTIGVRRPAR